MIFNRYSASSMRKYSYRKISIPESRIKRQQNPHDQRCAASHQAKVLPTGQKEIVTGQVTSQSDPPEAEKSRGRSLAGDDLDPQSQRKGRNVLGCDLDPLEPKQRSPPGDPEPEIKVATCQDATSIPGTQTEIGTWQVTTLDPPEPKRRTQLARL
ncbi:hypothetical protein B0H14DRAFT_2638212 [Mycena olivaceomarginata]|nr:hypothetical protein B0H14DRAFT_2638212 [Mycena olivaceomarginata]